MTKAQVEREDPVELVCMVELVERVVQGAADRPAVMVVKGVPEAPGLLGDEAAQVAPEGIPIVMVKSVAVAAVAAPAFGG